MLWAPGRSAASHLPRGSWHLSPDCHVGLPSVVLGSGVATAHPFRMRVRKGSQSIHRAASVSQLRLEQVFCLGQIMSPLRALLPFL